MLDKNVGAGGEQVESIVEHLNMRKAVVVQGSSQSGWLLECEAGWCWDTISSLTLPHREREREKEREGGKESFVKYAGDSV